MNEKQKKSKLALLAVILSAVALFLAVQERFSTENAAITSINRMITDRVVPRMAETGKNDNIRTIYELKHMMLTLDQIKETSMSPDVKTLIDQVKLQVEDLSVKLFVNE